MKKTLLMRKSKCGERSTSQCTQKKPSQKLVEKFQSQRNLLNLALCWVYCLQLVHWKMWRILSWYVYAFFVFAGIALLVTWCSHNVCLLLPLALMFGFDLFEVRYVEYFQRFVGFCGLVRAHATLFGSFPISTSAHRLCVIFHLICKRQAPHLDDVVNK